MSYSQALEAAKSETEMTKRELSEAQLQIDDLTAQLPEPGERSLNASSDLTGDDGLKGEIRRIKTKNLRLRREVLDLSENLRLMTKQRDLAMEAARKWLHEQSKATS